MPSGPDGRVQAAQGSSTEDAKFQSRRSWEGAAAVPGAEGAARGASQQPAAAREAEGVVPPGNPGRGALQGVWGFQHGAGADFSTERTELVSLVCSCPFFLAGFSSRSGESSCWEPAGIPSLWGAEAGRQPSAAGQ